MSEPEIDDVSPYRFWIEPANGGSPHLVDLHEFYFGMRQGDLTAKQARFWKSDIVGLPQIAAGFQQVLENERINEGYYKNISSSWRTFHRFIGDAEDLPPLKSLADIDEVFGLRFKQWLKLNGLGTTTYKRFKWVVDSYNIMTHKRLSSLPPRDPAEERDVVEPDFVGLQQLVLVLRECARLQSTMRTEGMRLAGTGEDPRFGLGRNSDSLWSKQENHAYLVRELTAHRVPSKDQIAQVGAGQLFFNSGQTGRDVVGPSYLSPGQSERAREGYVGKLRWFFPARHDMMVYVWLVLILTGFNLATALDIDVSEDSTWFVKALQDDDHVLIFATKEKTGQRVYSPSKVKASLHAFQIIKYVIEITRPLRNTLQDELDALKIENATSYSHVRQREIDRLERAVKSPWLFHSLNDAGRVSFISKQDASELNRIIRSVAKESGLTDDHPYLATLSTSQARDSMINFTWRHSGLYTIARLSAQHSNYRSLRYYLARKRQKRINFHTINKVVTHAFGQIARGEILDETKIRIAVKTGEFTPQQAERLLDYRKRTRYQMGCLDPTNPPANVDPHHVPGTVCKVQRCTGCIHGCVFAESVQPLSSGLADLHYLRRQTPLSSWKGSSFEAEELSIKQTLQQFDPALVKKHYQVRLEALKFGTARVFDVYPHY